MSAPTPAGSQVPPGGDTQTSNVLNTSVAPWAVPRRDETNDALTVSRAQAEWRAMKRREYEDKRRRKEEREHAMSVSKASTRGTLETGEQMGSQKKPRLDEDDEFDALHHHHLHHHHHHHLHHTDHIDHLHHHHHHHHAHDIVISIPGNEGEHEPPDIMKEIVDQKLAQAQWREQKKREIAERKAKRKFSRRGKKTSIVDEVPLLLDQAPRESAVPAQNTAAVPSSEVEVTHSLQVDQSEQAEHLHAHVNDLHVVHNHQIEHQHLDAHQPDTGGAMDVPLSVQGDVHNLQSQTLTPEQVLGNPEDVQDLHNNILNSWQSLDPLTPAQ